MPNPHISIRRASAALPAAIAGSLALSLVAVPAHADAAAAMTPKAPATLPQARAAGHAFGDAAATVLARAAHAQAARAVPTYRVVRGDTVSAIAARHRLRTADVLSWNGLRWSSIIYPGQILRLAPAGTAAGAAHHPVTPKAAAHKAPPAPKHATTPKPAKAPAPSRKSATYTVRSGDTVSAIARRHGASTQAVLTANHLRWSSIIHPGQKLVIPGTAPTEPAASAPTIAPKLAAASTPLTGSPASAGTVAPGAAYAVRAGDTMSGIAARHGVSVTALLHANDLDWSSIIYPGQHLAIPTSGIPGLTTEQAANARLIVQVGRQLGVPERGLAIALGTAMQESSLRNLDYGDRDSLGLFQQRPSTGWGTAAQVRDAERSIRVFFGGPADPNGTRTRGLLDIPGWESMSFAAAAQAVQISAYPSLYAQWEKPAYAWLAAIGG